MIFQTRINGILCYCRVDHYAAGVPDKVGGAFEDAVEGSDEEFNYTILDSRYIKAPWLDKQMDKDDEVRMREEFHVTRLEQKYLYGDSA